MDTLFHARDLFLEGLEILARPLVRFCLRRSLKYQDFVSVLKRVFVQVAREEVAKSGATESVSRLSVMTGLQRPDIAQLTGAAPPQKEASILARVVGQWAGSRKFCSPEGIPRALGFEGRTSEFASLVASVSKELNAYAVLFDLERVGLVERRDDQLHLLSTVYLSSNDLRESFSLLGRDVADLISAVEHNALEQPDVPNLHLKVHYDNIPLDDLPRLREWILNEGSQFVLKVQKHLAQFDKDLNPALSKKEGGGRIAMGIFSIAEGSSVAGRTSVRRAKRAP